MSHTALTSGALARICQGEDVAEPILQVLGHKAIAGSGQERFRLLLNDGEYSNSFSMLATQLNSLVHEDKIPQFSIIKVKKHICNQVAGQTKRVVIVLELEVLQRGEAVGKKIGNPVTIGSDGTVPPPNVQNQNANPNAGAAAKRPSDTPMGGGASKAAAPSAPRTSVLQPRPAASGGAAPQVTPIAMITPYQNKWTIKARVTSKGDVRTWNKASGSGKLFSMDLMDESGEIRVTAFKEQCDKFYDYAQVGKVYYVANCQVKAANKQYSKLNNEYELTFKDNGSMELVEDDQDVPTIVYNFMKIQELQRAEKDSTVDVMGVCKHVGEEVEIMTRAGKELKKREITLVDQSAHEVLLTLWGMTASTFEGAGFPIIATKGAKVSDFNGVTLSGGDILVNPDIEQAHELKGWWDNEGSSAAVTTITVQGMRSGGGNDGVLKMIGEVKQENLGYGSDRGEYYGTTGIITFFSKDKALYRACGKETDGKQCNKKVIENGDDTYRCEKCNEDKSNFTWRIMLQMNIADCTDNTWASAFQETGEKVLNIGAQDLGRLMESDEDAYNKVFSEATFKAYSFRMRVKADTYNDETKLKHTVVDVTEMDWAVYAKKISAELEAAGQALPEGLSTKY